MSADNTLTKHLQLCDHAYQILSEENASLKNEGRISSELIDRKRELLEHLDHSLEALKRLENKPEARTGETNQLIDRAQKRLMQIFLLDRENERLMYKYQNTTPHSSLTKPPRQDAYLEEAESSGSESFSAQMESSWQSTPEDATEPTSQPDSHTASTESTHYEDPSDSETNEHRPGILKNSRLHRAYRTHLEEGTQE